MDSTSRILIVDDDPIFLAVTAGIVGSLGYEFVDAVDSAGKGIELLRRGEQFALIILDLNMPGLDGLAFLRQASELGFRGGVVISSGESDAVLRSAEQMGRLLQVRVLGGLTKPLSPEKLAGVLARQAETQHGFPRRPALLPDSLEHLDLVPYYQPQHDSSRGHVVGLEALIRGRGTDGQIYGPGKLFGLIQGREQLYSTSLEIVDAVLCDMQHWMRAGCLPRTSINLDTSLVEDGNVVAELLAAVRRAGIDPQKVCWEVTETTLSRDLTRLIEGLTRLRMSGCQLSLDDFGTGGSNFEVLRLCPFTELKIDGQLLRMAVDEPVTQRFIASAVGIAHDLQLDLVAEGVETRAQYDFAKQQGIRVIQGFWFSKPMPRGEIDELLAGRSNVPLAG